MNKAFSQLTVRAAGETRTIRQVRDYLKNDRGVPRDCLDVTGYWRR